MYRFPNNSYLNKNLTMCKLTNLPREFTYKTNYHRPNNSLSPLTIYMPNINKATYSQTINICQLSISTNDVIYN